jgi:hypothetical protein
MTLKEGLHQSLYSVTRQLEAEVGYQIPCRIVFR